VSRIALVCYNDRADPAASTFSFQRILAVRDIPTAYDTEDLKHDIAALKELPHL
jgi:hypothetical protein